MSPILLTPTFHERVWGVTDLAPFFPGKRDKTLGEAWFIAEPPLPILAKFLFTSDNLSVQVHPAGGRGVGKSEMWHILSARPGARIALGFTRPVAAQELREAALSGEIEQLLRWFPVDAGETYFVPARTVHAIGAGLTICEIQQNSDITYRLYDYRRPRELHLDRGLEVIDPGSWRHPGAIVQTVLPDGWTRLAECRYFATDSLRIDRAMSYKPDPERFEFLICVEGAGRLNGAQFSAGAVWLAREGSSPIEIESDGGLRLLRSYVPRR